MKAEDEAVAPLDEIDFDLDEDCESCKLWTALKKSGPGLQDTWWENQIMIALMCLSWHCKKPE
jgi:hypothetical protein